MAQVLDIAGLSREAKHYQPGLKTLPYHLLKDLLKKWGIRLLQVENEDIIIHFLRRAGLWKPYAPGTAEYNTQLAQIQESKLTLDMAYAAVKEHIDNYITKKVLNGVDLAGSGYLSKKKHPLQQLITANMVLSATEDLIPALWFGKRDLADKSPMGLFDGFHEKIDAKIVSGEIATGKKNLINTGAIIDPTTAGKETEAIKQLVAFVDGLNGFLRANAIIFMSRGTLRKAQDALENLWTNKDVKYASVLEYINAKTGSNIKAIHTDEALGTGDRIIATVAGNFDFGMNTFTDKDFVQIRDIYEDPNELQLWIQAKFGTRIIITHRKVFAVNDQTQTAPSDFAGDF